MLQNFITSKNIQSSNPVTKQNNNRQFLFLTRNLHPTPKISLSTFQLLIQTTNEKEKKWKKEEGKKKSGKKPSSRLTSKPNLKRGSTAPGVRLDTRRFAPVS